MLKNLEFKLGGPTTNVFCQYFVEEAKVNEKTVSLAMVSDYYFLAHDSIQHICLVRYMLSPVRMYVCLSVTQVYYTKTKVRIIKFSPYSSRMKV